MTRFFEQARTIKQGEMTPAKAVRSIMIQITSSKLVVYGIKQHNDAGSAQMGQFLKADELRRPPSFSNCQSICLAYVVHCFILVIRVRKPVVHDHLSVRINPTVYF
jgi:hypothetical protein